jgi:hypothetical protein
MVPTVRKKQPTATSATTTSGRTWATIDAPTTCDWPKTVAPRSDCPKIDPTAGWRRPDMVTRASR